MDKTSVKAGRVAPGKMRTAYFWPVYGAEPVNDFETLPIAIY